MAKVLNTQHFMQMKGATADNFELARRELFKSGIKTSYDESRMIYSVIHSYKNQLNSVYVQECNGLILELGTWKPLMVPPHNLRFNIITETSNKFLYQGLYHIYEVEDGTCVNLYYYKNKWCVSTARGYEMNGTKWDGLTYEQLLSDCLAEYDLTWETFTEQLDKTHCYSYGFKHAKFHHFNSHNNSRLYKMWFIQSVDLNPESDQYLWASGRVPFESGITQQKLCEAKESNLHNLYERAKSAYQDFVNGQEPCFGFILRSVNREITGMHSDLFIESTLMKHIRKLWYDDKLIKQTNTNNWDKETAVSLNAYLNKNFNEIFITLFPQYQDKYALYSDAIKHVVDKMIDKTNRAPTNSVLTELTPPLTDEKLNVATLNLLTSFKYYVSYNLENKTTEQKRRVFYEYTNNVRNIDALIELF